MGRACRRRHGIAISFHLDLSLGWCPGALLLSALAPMLDRFRASVGAGRLVDNFFSGDGPPPLP